MNHYNNKRAIAKQVDFAKMQRIAEFVAPNLIASFCLTLYDNTDMSLDDIHYLCSQMEELWTRSEKEGWNIQQNCYDLTGVDVRRWSETGNIEYNDKFKPMTMAQRAERVRKERAQNGS